MKEFWNFGGGYTRIAGKIFDTLILGALCLICCIPVVTIGASSSALYYSFVKCVRQDRGYVAKEFLHGLRLNWKSASVGWLGTLIVAAAALWNLTIVNRMEANNFTAFLLVLNVLVLILIAGLSVYLYPVISRFEGGIWWYIKLSTYLMIRHLGITALGILVLAMAGIFVYRIPLLALLLPGPMCWLMSELLENALQECEPPTGDSGDNGTSESP